MQLALSAKRLELLKEALPAYSARKMAKNQFSCGIGGKIPWNTHLPQITRAFALYDAQSADQVPSTVADAASLGLQLQPLDLRDPPYDFEGAMNAVVQARAEALVVLSSPLFCPHGVCSGYG